MKYIFLKTTPEKCKEITLSAGDQVKFVATESPELGKGEFACIQIQIADDCVLLIHAQTMIKGNN